jgi:hypothetical protein
MAVLVAAALFAVAACGGGGGNSIVPGPGNPPADQTQYGTVQGKLTDAGLAFRGTSQAEDPAPLSGVIVQLVEKLTGRVIGETLTDANGEFKFEMVPAGEQYQVKVKLELEFDLNGDGTPDKVELSFEVMVTPGQATELIQMLGLADADGDGIPDSIDVETELRDGDGVHQERTRHRQRDGETQIDSNGDGTFDDSVSDDDADGIANEHDSDDDNDGIRDEGDDDQNGDGMEDNVEFELTGTIDAVGEGTLTVDGVEYAFDQNTRFLNDTGEPVTLAEFPAGTFVEIEGWILEDGSMYLKKVKIEDESEVEGGDDNGTAFEFKGTIEAVGDGAITVDGQVYTFDEFTKFLNDSGNLITLAELAVGMFVEIEGWTLENGSMYLKKLKIEDETEDGIGDDNGGNGDDDGEETGDDHGGNGGDDDGEETGDDNGGNGGDDDGEETGDDNGGNGDDDGEETGDDNGGNGDDDGEETGDDNGGNGDDDGEETGDDNGGNGDDNGGDGEDGEEEDDN